jgi:hypothetical protein
MGSTLVNLNLNKLAELKSPSLRTFVENLTYNPLVEFKFWKPFQGKLDIGPNVDLTTPEKLRDFIDEKVLKGLKAGGGGSAGFTGTLGKSGQWSLNAQGSAMYNFKEKKTDWQFGFNIDIQW